MHDIDHTFMEAENYEDESNELYGEVFSEEEVSELAAELLSVSSEAELEHFLGDLIKKAGKAVGKFASSGLGKSLGGVLKSVAKTALPLAGSALGNMVLPGLGGAIGSKLASGAGSMLGLELEGLSQEDQEFEAAKQVVRLAGDATKNALSAPSSNPVATARGAVTRAASKFAPGLVGQSPGRRGGAAGATGATGAASGRWVRRGNRIIVLGA